MVKTRLANNFSQGVSAKVGSPLSNKVDYRMRMLNNL